MCNKKELCKTETIMRSVSNCTHYFNDCSE